MKTLAAALLAFALLPQEEVPKIVPGDVTPTKWPVSGPADAEDGAELSLRGRRVVRIWDFARKRFNETLENAIIRSTVAVSHKRFEGSFKANLPGRYGLSISDEDKLLYSEKVALGSIEPLFARTPEDIKTMLEAKDKGLTFLDEIEKILERRTANGQRERDEFLKRVNVWAVKIDELKGDLTASKEVLRQVYFHIRNVQVWEEEKLPPPGANDPPRNKKKIFVDMELTIEALRKILDSMPEIISSETRVSTTLILERLFAQAGTTERRKETARNVARAASKLADGLPVADRDLVRLLDQATDKTTDIAELRTALSQSGTALVSQ